MAEPSVPIWCLWLSGTPLEPSWPPGPDCSSTSNGTIRVDHYMRTEKNGVYAVGDCSQTSGFITGRTDNIMLASTATAEARVLGYNLFRIGLLRNFSGTLSVFSTEFDGYVFASAGAIEQTAEEANVEYVVGRFEDVDRHPASLPGAMKIRIKIIVSPDQRRHHRL